MSVLKHPVTFQNEVDSEKSHYQLHSFWWSAVVVAIFIHFWSFWDHFNWSFSSSCCTKAIQGALPSAESPGTRPWQWKKTRVLESAKLILREFIVKIREMFTKIGEFQTKWVAKFLPDCFCFQHVQLQPVAASVHHPTRCNQPLTCKLLP